MPSKEASLRPLDLRESSRFRGPDRERTARRLRAPFLTDRARACATLAIVRGVVAGVLGCVTLVVASTASAQPASAQPASAQPANASSPDVLLAREKVKEGVAAANAGNWTEARAAFTEAYRLYPRAGILFNLAGAEVQTGHVLAGIEAYRKVLLQPAGLTSAQVTLAQSSLRAAEARLAHVTLHLAKPRDCTVTLDDVAFPLDEERDADPGPHRATLACVGVNAERTDFTLEAGEKRVVELHPPVPVAPPPPPREPPKTSSTSRTVGIVLAAGAAIALGTSAATGFIGLGRHDDLEESCAPTGTCAPSDVNNAKTFVTISDVTLVAGVVLGAGAIYALFVHRAIFKEPKSSTASAVGAPFIVRF